MKAGDRLAALSTLGERCGESKRKVAALSLVERVEDPQVRESLKPRQAEHDESLYRRSSERELEQNRGVEMDGE